jgi:sporulation protein YlmC with PRC-barrel domain
MLRAASNLKGMSIAATDGDIGSVQDLYFDDMSWTIRYLVVDTGTWLPGRKVLISPMSVAAGDRSHAVPVRLTKSQVESSPSVDADKPVNRQYEEEYSQYYGYPYYWSGPYRWGAVPYPGESTWTAEAMPAALIAGGGDPALRSVRDVTGYYIEASDGDIGHVEDFLVDDREWAIRYMVVDTRNWWPGKKVVVSPGWISRVSWVDSKVYVDLSRDGVQTAPEYDSDRIVEREYETRLFKHYGRRNYWE